MSAKPFKLFSVAIFFLLSFPLFCSASGNAIVIGQAIDLSGPNAAIGRDYVAGIKTCFDAINDKGGINGRRVQYVVRDDQGRPELAAKAAAELIENVQADYLLGGVGEAAAAVLEAPAFKRSGMILFAPLASARRNSDARVLFWRPGYQQEIRYLLSHFSKLGIKNVGIVVQETAVNVEAYRNLSEEIRERGMKVTGTARIGADGGRMAQQASQLAATNPGFVVVIADSIGSGLFLKEFRMHAARTFVAGTSLINLSTLREVAGAKGMEWTVFSQVVPNPNASSSPIQIEHSSMMRKYRDESVSSLTLEGYAVAKVLAAAIQQARSSRSALHDLLARGSEIDLGGLSIAGSVKSGSLSGYLDIALFRKDGGLVY